MGCRDPGAPQSTLRSAGEIRRYGNIVVALSRLCLANPIFSLLPLLQCLVDSELRPLKSSIRKTRISAGRKPQTARIRKTTCSRGDA